MTTSTQQEFKHIAKLVSPKNNRFDPISLKYTSSNELLTIDDLAGEGIEVGHRSFTQYAGLFNHEEVDIMVGIQFFSEREELTVSRRHDKPSIIGVEELYRTVIRKLAEDFKYSNGAVVNIDQHLSEELQQKIESGLRQPHLILPSMFYNMGQSPISMDIKAGKNYIRVLLEQGTHLSLKEPKTGKIQTDKGCILVAELYNGTRLPVTLYK